MPTAAQISPKQPARKGILKSPPAREEPAPKSQKVEIDLSDGDAAMGAPPGLPAGVPVLPSEFGGSGSSGVLSGFNYGGSLSNSEVQGVNGDGEKEGGNGGRKGEEEEKEKMRILRCLQ